MALRYYPLTRIVTNRYTRGGEFVLENGTPYTGRYYTTYDGSSFTGANPTLGTSNPLFRTAKTDLNSDLTYTRRGATGISNLSVLEQNQVAIVGEEDLVLKQLTPYFPVPSEDDYQRGYFTRYFAKNISGPGYIFEISKKAWSQIQNGEIANNVLGYETANMLWQLTGPKNNTRISQYQIQGGVYDTNKRVTEAEEKTFRGIVAFIGGDYTKFARITP